MKNLRFMTPPQSLVIDIMNTEVNNNFRFHPITVVERKLNMTSMVKKSGERGPFHNSPVRTRIKISV